jgi:hypothetical protein
MRRAVNGAATLLALPVLAIASPRAAAVAMASGANAAKPTASTPPMGWNSWATFVRLCSTQSSLLWSGWSRRSSLLTCARAAAQGCAVNETILTDAANQMHALGLAPAGYQYVNTDDCE